MTGKCTLRAAIEESNNSIGETDTIGFTQAFDGSLSHTIELGSSLPKILDPVRIEGNPSTFQCETGLAGLKGPCVGIDGPAAGPAFRVDAERVVIKGFAVTGAEIAISAHAAPGLEAWNNWLGFKLDGSSGAIGVGIYIDPHSPGAFIGGSSALARNIISNSTEVGLHIDGADNAVVRGNGFGISPLGGGRAENQTDISINDSVAEGGFDASNNVIGGTAHAEELESAECDGGCNVISGASSSGIDLSGIGTGDPPASGPTGIRGNYVGLNAFGTAGVPNLEQSILVGGAGEVEIGGPEPGDANNINGGSFGVVAGPAAPGLVVEANRIGVNPSASSALAAPSQVAVAVDSGISGPMPTEPAESGNATVRGNRISMSSGIGIWNENEGAILESNSIGLATDGGALPAPSIGIRVSGDSGDGNLVSQNAIENAGKYGLLIESSRNQVIGNLIEHFGESGIHVEAAASGAPPTENELGDSTETGENVISHGSGSAIEILGPSSSDNQIARNLGVGDAGQFIDLGGDGPGNSSAGPNDGVQAPTITSLSPSSIAGSARAGASVLVYGKSTASTGELATYLGRTTVAPDGQWTFFFGAETQAGSSVAATQTYEAEPAPGKVVHGSSELGIATLQEAPGNQSVVKGPTVAAECRLFGDVLCQVDERPPRTILKHPPGKRIHVRTATFRFVSNEPGSHFECQMDSRPPKGCRSPVRYQNLRPGRHLFKVWAIDAAGNKARYPASRHIQVLRSGSR
jgi:hypothetical protein